jgi:hypothetical protein
MKLRGSITESNYRNDLIGSREYLYETLQGERVRRALTQVYGNTRTAYVLGHTPGQGEDLFRILVDGKDVVGFDLQHGDECKALNVSIDAVKDYQRMLTGRRGRLLLAIALELSASP